jgi:hypothetical protein
MSQADATLREVLDALKKRSVEVGQPMFSLDFGPEDVGDHILVTVSIGKDARNSMARILNTFMDDPIEGDVR